MKKGCLIVVILCVLLAIAAGAAATVAAKKAGLFAAPEISHTTLVTPKNRLSVILNPGAMVNALLPMFPESIPAGPVTVDPKKWVAEFLPYEAALLATPNLATGKIEATVFVNEKRGGPMLVEMAKQQPLPVVPGVTFAPEGLELPERGNLQLRCTLPVPESVEAVIAENWKQATATEPLLPEGTHHLEIILDNRNGDLLSFASALVNANGGDWDTIFADNSQQFMPFLPGMHDVRIGLSLVDLNSAKGQLRIDATAESGGGLAFVLGMGWAFAVGKAKTDYGLEITGEPKWVEEKEAIIADFQIKGLEPHLRKLAAKP